jgi:hypothetical protein
MYVGLHQDHVEYENLCEPELLHHDNLYNILLLNYYLQHKGMLELFAAGIVVVIAVVL